MYPFHRAMYRFVTYNGSKVTIVTCCQRGCKFRAAGNYRTVRPMVEEHRRREIRRARYRALFSAYHDETKTQEAMRELADAASHSYNEWLPIVEDMVLEEAGVNIRFHPEEELMKYYLEGNDTRVAAKRFIDRPITQTDVKKVA